MPKDIIVKINDSATIKAENDVAVYSFTVQSNTTQDTKEGYDAIIPIVTKIRKLVSGLDIIENLRTDYRTETVMEYEPQTKVVGYKTNGYIQFDAKLNNNDQVNTIVSGLQKSIIGLSNNSAKVFINDITYSLSEKKRKQVELDAIKKAINYAKKQAQMVVETAYSTTNYTIIKLDVSTNSANNVSPIYRSAMAMRQSGTSDAPVNVVSQGVSEVRADVVVEISVNKG